MTAAAALPGVAESTRRGDLWLHGVFADALAAAAPSLAARERNILARSLLLLLDHWALRLEPADTAACAALAVRMVLGAAPHPPIAARWAAPSPP